MQINELKLISAFLDKKNPARSIRHEAVFVIASLYVFHFYYIVSYSYKLEWFSMVDWQASSLFCDLQDTSVILKRL